MLSAVVPVLLAFGAVAACGVLPGGPTPKRQALASHTTSAVTVWVLILASASPTVGPPGSTGTQLCTPSPSTQWVLVSGEQVQQKTTRTRRPQGSTFARKMQVRSSIC